ncbi:5-oxoprolinase subunit C family protein [Pontibacter cellulosilyticus]|uniref:Biotin-dependent carboxyltransferase family protein n=1 Tax=Pontibacter cellulosilyticus TaxID=1720253 RepID=A0A923N3V8_9BACT|nr:biotin-dependent carboxyltransferase family protein [Pontibacter cellulosilyticus]MBC5992023.1 biotin-dependent carboxyltransferase family protein [Pontibacter cellulosilyticus]
MSIKVVKPGLLTTIQDLGRQGHQQEGVIVSGAMDTFAMRIANLLVSNPENTATLEATLQGPTLYFEQDQLIALTGADMAASINGKPVRMWRPLLVRGGSTLTFKTAREGCRCYIAVSGGMNVPKVMGSAATYLRAGFGGYHGRALQADDVIHCRKYNETDAAALSARLSDEAIGEWFAQPNWTLEPQPYMVYEEQPVIRAMRGIEYELFDETSQEGFWQHIFQVTPQSDRMGYRLLGQMLQLQEPKELLSSAVTFGTVQVPPQGMPIILMADHQTTGGYPRIAQVIAADLPKLAQVQPGKNIQFKEVSLQEANAFYLKQEMDLEQLKSAISLKLNTT